MSLSTDIVENISALVSKADYTLTSNYAFYSSSSDIALIASSTTSSDTWSLATSCLSSFSHVKVFRDFIMTYLGISSKVYPSRVAAFFSASSFAFFFMAFSALALLLAFARE